MSIMGPAFQMLSASWARHGPALDTQPAEPAAHPRLPRHVAIVMDGNGRWARARGLPRLAGHMQGAEAVRAAVTGCAELGVAVLSLYAFSAQNWSRSPEEVQGLMKLLKRFLASETPELAEKGIRLRLLGSREGLPAEVVAGLDAAEALTAAGTRLCLNLAVNYGAQEELAHAARTAARECLAGTLRPEQIDARCLESRLYTRGQPPVDLLIRTAGERRISNFLLFQCAYAEFVFLDVLWPDFGRPHLAQALGDYARRRRTFGSVADTSAARPG